MAQFIILKWQYKQILGLSGAPYQAIDWSSCQTRGCGLSLCSSHAVELSTIREGRKRRRSLSEGWVHNCRMRFPGIKDHCSHSMYSACLNHRDVHAMGKALKEALGPAPAPSAERLGEEELLHALGSWHTQALIDHYWIRKPMDAVSWNKQKQGRTGPYFNTSPLRNGWQQINAKKCSGTHRRERQNKRAVATVSLGLPCLLEDFSLVSLIQFSFYLVYYPVCFMVITRGCPRGLHRWGA